MRCTGGARALRLLLLSGLAANAAAAQSTDRRAQFWLTTGDRAHLLARQPDIPLSSATDSVHARIEIDTTQRFQKLAGFGAAITDASATLIQNALPARRRDALLRELFGRRNNGIGLSVVRLTIGASDFSSSHYTFDDIPPHERDDSLAHFSIAAQRSTVLPVVQRARAINRALTVIATPWSAPAWMKSSHSLIGGTLRRDAYAPFAEYLRRYVTAMEAAGVAIDALTIQNEPHHEPKDYPGMRFEAPARAQFIGGHLGPLFARHRIRTAILDWDHNWDEPASPLTVLRDSTAAPFVSGVAWHCYAGDVRAQTQVHDQFPTRDTWFTECAGGAWAPDFGANLVWNVRTLIIGATRNWARGVVLWNLALDDRHGPHLGGCDNCRGVITIERATGRVTRNEEYYALAHASRFVLPGAERIGSTPDSGGVESVAFRNPDATISVVLCNASGGTRRVLLRMSSQQFLATLPAGSVATIRL